uniref:Uncharacterized protein n=1 Tax=Arundo donax TaxID=35708 RepID=A0A0A9A8Y0_ARUDO
MGHRKHQMNKGSHINTYLDMTILVICILAYKKSNGNVSQMF